jgi:hypothetical protein
MWAVYKVVANGDKDLGAISFFFVITSSALVILCGSCCNKKHKCARIPSILLLISTCLVSLNYAYPILTMDLPLTFKIYLVVGIFYWAYMSYWNWISVMKGEEYYATASDEPLLV